MTDDDSADLSHLVTRPDIADMPKTIRLSHPAITIVRFLDIASVSSPIFNTTFDQTVELLALVNEIHAHKLLDRLKARLYRVMSKESRAADLLLLASANDDWPMGRFAIKCLSATQAQMIGHDEESFHGFFEKLRPIWRRTLLDLVFFTAYTASSTNGTKLFWDWASLSSRFVAPKETPEKRKSDEDGNAAQKRVKSE